MFKANITNSGEYILQTRVHDMSIDVVVTQGLLKQSLTINH